LSLFIGQAFLYNAVTFDLGTILNTFFGVSSSTVPYFMVLFAAGNFLGPLLLGRLFDTVGRIPMIAGTYLGSAAMVTVLALLLRSGALTTWSFMALVAATFFLASAGASSAYLTVSEIFPMETRALAIALFYAIGTAVGGISGPVLFGHFIHSGNADQIATGFLIGAAAMAVGGIAEMFLGVRAERRSLEAIARPLTAEEEAADPQLPPPPAAPDRDQRIAARNARRRARRVPGPGDTFYSPGMVGTAGTTSRHRAIADLALDREIEAIARALDELDATYGDHLEQRVGGRGWGPWRFRRALRDAVSEGRVRRREDDRYEVDHRSERA
jgi:MFS family permease